MDVDQSEQEEREARQQPELTKSGRGKPSLGRSDTSADRGPRPTWVDRRGFTRFLEALIALSAATTALVGYWQWQAMKATNALTTAAITEAAEANRISREVLKDGQRQAESNRREAARLAEEARLQSTLQASASLELARQSLHQARVQADTSRTEAARLADEARKQSAVDASASLELARQSLNQARTSLETTQRARVTVIEVLPYRLVPGGKENVRARLKNSGYVSATNLQIWSGVTIGPGELPAQVFVDRNVPPESVSVLAAGERQIAKIEVDKLSRGGLNDLRIAAIRAGRATFYIYGVGRYDDGFEKQREFGFCWLHDSSGDEWTICPSNNWAD